MLQKNKQTSKHKQIAIYVVHARTATYIRNYKNKIPVSF